MSLHSTQARQLGGFISMRCLADYRLLPGTLGKRNRLARRSAGGTHTNSNIPIL